MENKLGNPALIAAAAQNPMVKEQIKETSIRIKKGMGIIGKGMIIVGAVVAARIITRNIQRNNILKNIDKNPNYQAATRLYALFPEKMKSKSLFDPETIINSLIAAVIPIPEKTQVEQIMNVGKDITDFQETAKAFKGLYRADLRLCLEKLLSANDLRTFYNYTSSHKTGSIKVNPFQQEKKGFRVVTSSETSVLTLSKSPGNKLSKPIALSSNIPASVSLGTYEGGKVANVIPNDNREFYVTKFGVTKDKYTVYLLVSVKGARLVPYTKTHTFRTLIFHPSTGKVTKID